MAVATLIPLYGTFLKFHTHAHLEEDLVRSFQNISDNSSRVLKWNPPEVRVTNGQKPS